PSDVRIPARPGDGTRPSDAGAPTGPAPSRRGPRTPRASLSTHRRARSARSRSTADHRSRAPGPRNRSPCFIPLSRGILDETFVVPPGGLRNYSASRGTILLWRSLTPTARHGRAHAEGEGLGALLRRRDPSGLEGGTQSVCVRPGPSATR